MEKIFKPNKLFLFFCIFFVLEFLGLQIVSYLHITNQARLDGERIFNWQWPSKNKRSIAKIYETKILSRNSNDAVVKVLANEQIIGAGDVGAGVSPPLFSPVSSDSRVNSHRPQQKCAAILNYYRMNNKWFLGKVEFE